MWSPSTISTALQLRLQTDHRTTFEKGRFMESRVKHEVYGLAKSRLQTGDRFTSSKVQTRLKRCRYEHEGGAGSTTTVQPSTRPLAGSGRCNKAAVGQLATPVVVKNLSSAIVSRIFWEKRLKNTVKIDCVCDRQARYLRPCNWGCRLITDWKRLFQK